jgi:hypothetical protein
LDQVALKQYIGGIMSYKILDRFRKQEADNIALSVKLNRWSRVLIEVMVREQEARLLASDLPVEGGAEDNFWEELSGL